MPTDVKVPTLGESITEATLGAWLKHPGDAVAADEPIATLETDKVSVDVPSPVAGTFGEALVAEGDTVAVGALIARIGPDSPAANAKLQEGDVILELNGRKVATTQMLQAVVERLEIDKTYKALIVRDGAKLEVPITVREMPENFLAGSGRPGNGSGRGRQNPQPQEESFNALGLQVKDLTESAAKELGFEDKVAGVVVSGVEPNSAAAQAGILVGKVIEKVGGKKIASLKEFDEALKTASLKDGVTLLVSSPTGKSFVVVQSDSK